MPIEISTQIIHASFATVINKIQPNANIYDNPNQQGTTYPAWFIVHRSPVEVQKESGKRFNGNRYLITYQIDLWYMLKQNITRLFDQYTQIAEQLEYHLQYLPIFGSDAVVHVYDQSWSLELNALKYSVTLKLRVYTDENFVLTPMEVIEDLSIFLKNQRESIVSFTNTEHPEFDPVYPNSFSVTTGRKVNLPYVTGTFEDDYYKWTPSAWTLGYFGELIQVNENLTANLEWESSEKTVYPQGQFAFGEMQLNPEIFVRLNAVSIDSFSNELMSVSGVQISTCEFVDDAGLSFVMSQNGLMKSTGIQQSYGEFIDDAGLSFVMSQNELMEIWDKVRVQEYNLLDVTTSKLEFSSASEIHNILIPLHSLPDSGLSDPTPPPPELPTVIIQQGFVLYTAADSMTYTEIQPGASTLLYLLSGEQCPYPSDITFCICGLNSAEQNLDKTKFEIYNNNGFAYLKNNSSSAAHIVAVYPAICESDEAEVVAVYDSQDNPFNAFKFTLDGVDYYYVLDLNQEDWTDDLSSIGYHLPPDYIDVFFYLSSIASYVTFAANDYWGTWIIDNTDKSALESFGVTVEQITVENGTYNAVSKTNFESFNFEPIGLYTGDRTGETSADMTNFYCAEGPSVDINTYGKQVCIWSRNAYGVSVKTWKCRILNYHDQYTPALFNAYGKRQAEQITQNVPYYLYNKPGSNFVYSSSIILKGVYNADGSENTETFVLTGVNGLLAITCTSNSTTAAYCEIDGL